MKSKGFVFVETIVIVVVLSLGLVMVYQSFNNVLANTKRRAYYNDVSYIYRTYYIEDFITSLNIEQFVDYYIVNKGKTVQEFSCKNPLLYNVDANVYVENAASDLSEDDQKRLDYCEKLLVNYKVKRIYSTKYNVNELKKCATRAGKLAANCKSGVNQDALNTMSPSMIYYIRTLTGTLENTYRIIVEYEEDVVDSDSTVKKVMRNGSLQCPSTFVENNGVCEKTVKKRFYSNVAMVIKKK